MKFTDVEKFAETLRNRTLLKCSAQWDYTFDCRTDKDGREQFVLSLAFKDQHIGAIWEHDWMTVREAELPVMMEIYNNVKI